MSQYSADLRYGLRQLRLNPLFTAVAVLSLALGIGANIAIFELIDAIRMRPLPVANPQDLAYLDFAHGSKRSGWWSSRSANFTSKQWESLQQHQQAFSGMIAWSAQQFNLNPEGKARFVDGLFVSGDFFNLLNVPAVAGRVFTARDDQPGCGSPGAVIGYSFWQSEFAGDPAVTSRTVQARWQHLSCNRRGRARIFRRGDRQPVRCRRAHLRRPYVLGGGQRTNSQPHRLVALADGTPEAGMDARSRQRPNPGHRPRRHA